eukprot:8216449-Pyramimonas_sp.AAC.1
MLSRAAAQRMFGADHSFAKLCEQFGFCEHRLRRLTPARNAPIAGPRRGRHSSSSSLRSR